MPEARGDIREIVGQPVFVPLYKLFLLYGKVGLTLHSSWAHISLSHLCLFRRCRASASSSSSKRPGMLDISPIQHQHQARQSKGKK